MYFLIIRPTEKSKDTYMKLDEEDVWTVDDRNGNLSTLSIEHPESIKQGKPSYATEGYVMTEDKDHWTIEPITIVATE
jgi:hypothetical protein